MGFRTFKVFNCILISLLFLIIACNSDALKSPSNTQKNSNKYANFFEIVRNDSNLTVFTTKTVSNIHYTYILNAAQKSQVKNDTFYLKKNIQRIVCLSSVYCAYLNNLNALHKIVAVDNKKYICNNSLLNLIDSGVITEVGETHNLNIEKIISLQPDLIITYGDESSSTVFSKFTENNIPVLNVYDYLENHPLGRTEWLKVFGLLLNKFQNSVANFEQIEKNYLTLKEKNKATTNQPGVFFEMALNDVWYMPGGKSYLSNLASDAGASYLWNENNETGSLKLSFENVFQKAVNSDYWLHQHFSNSLQDVLNADNKYENFSAFKNKKLYNNNRQTNTNGGNAFWENGLLYADSLLADLTYIFHPENLPQHKLVYYQKLE